MGFSLGEMFLVVIVGIIVVGPKRLPGMMRTAGQWVSRLRRMSMDLRSQSGIDDLLRQEGLTQHINELRSLSRFNVVETLMAPTAAGGAPARPPLDTPGLLPPRADRPRPAAWKPEEPLREREYPLIGCDAYGCLPDSAVIYVPKAEPAAAETTGATDAKPDEAANAAGGDLPAAEAPAADVPAAEAPAVDVPAPNAPAVTPSPAPEATS